MLRIVESDTHPQQHRFMAADGWVRCSNLIFLTGSLMDWQCNDASFDEKFLKAEGALLATPAGMVASCAR